MSSALYGEGALVGPLLHLARPGGRVRPRRPGRAEPFRSLSQSRLWTVS